MSLCQLLGSEYMDAVCEGAGILHGMTPDAAGRIAAEQVCFFPESFADRLDSLLPLVGTKIASGIERPLHGAPTDAFRKATAIHASPVGACGFFRLGEDGRLYLVSKSEHYHTPLGHAFPGYRLLALAQMLGITNATHNNTRGYITRLLEQELVRGVNGIDDSDPEGLQRILDCTAGRVLNRVINLETGTLAVEAGIKMMLARFYRLDKTATLPRYHGRTPVFFVLGDLQGGREANYHGTTIFAQTMRDLWPDFHQKAKDAALYEVVPVSINDIGDFRTKLTQYNTGTYKTAGFLHEIILMNYGGMRLREEYLQEAYRLCQATDTPVLCDEIQSCMWYPGMFLFRLYGLAPDFVVVGKGFPGGQYAASRILTTPDMDSLNLFGALVTNGQEELASLAYLVTMAFAKANGEYISEIGEYYEQRALELATRHGSRVRSIEGRGLLLTFCFHATEDAIAFSKRMSTDCIDISAQTYKASCPPAALTKLPLIATPRMVDYIIDEFDKALKSL